MASLQILTQLLKASRQFPLTKNRRMIQSPRPTPENGQVMLLLEDQLTTVIAAPMRGYRGVGRDNIDTIYIGLDRYRLKGPTTGYCVTVAVKTNRLIFVHPSRLVDTGIESMLWQRTSGRFVTLKTFAYRLSFARHLMGAFT
jgi:hypothetical protein